jgi:hypothetical protein
MAKRQHHPTRAQREARIMDVYPLVVDGFHFAQIKEIVAHKCGWSVPERTLWRYVAAARELVRAQADFARQEKFAEAVAFLERLRLRASMAGELGTALRVQCELNRLYDLLAPDKLEVYDFSGYSDQQLAQEVCRELPELLREAERLTRGAAPSHEDKDDGSEPLDPSQPDGQAG